MCVYLHRHSASKHTCEWQHLSGEDLFHALMERRPDLGIAADGDGFILDRGKSLTNHFNEFVMRQTLKSSTYIHLKYYKNSQMKKKRTYLKTNEIYCWLKIFKLQHDWSKLHKTCWHMAHHQHRVRQALSGNKKKKSWSKCAPSQSRGFVASPSGL